MVDPFNQVRALTLGKACQRGRRQVAAHSPSARSSREARRPHKPSALTRFAYVVGVVLIKLVDQLLRLGREILSYRIVRKRASRTGRRYGRYQHRVTAVLPAPICADWEAGRIVRTPDRRLSF